MHAPAWDVSERALRGCKGSLCCPCETGPALRSHLKNPRQSAAPEQSWDGSADCWGHQAGPSEASCASSRPSGHCERHAAEHSGLLTSKIARHEFRPARIGMYFCDKYYYIKHNDVLN